MSDSEEKVPETNSAEVKSLAANLDDVKLETTENTEKKVEEVADKVATPTADVPVSSPAKIEILLKAVGNAPILKKKKFLLDRTKNVHYIIEWLKKYMKLEIKEQLFVYVNQEFAPSPDAEIGTIYDCFRTGNNVILHYCTTPAWG